MLCPDCSTLNGPSDRTCHVCGRDLAPLRAAAPIHEPIEDEAESSDALPANVLRPHELQSALGSPRGATPPVANDATALHLRAKAGVPLEDSVRCPSCGASNHRGVRDCRLCGLEVPMDADEIEALRIGPSWERRTGFLDIRALWATTVEVFTSPRKTFERMRRGGGIEAPLSYVAAIWLLLFPLLVPLGWIGTNAFLSQVLTAQPGQGGAGQQELVELIDVMRDAWEGNADADELERRIEELERQRSQPGQTPPPGPAPAQPRKPLQIPFVFFALGFPLIFLASLIGLFLSAGFLHLGLKLVGSAQSPLETTFRVCAYVSGPVLLLSLIPVVNSISGLVHIVLIAIGLSRAHDTGIGNVIGGWILMAVLLGIATCGAGGACIAGLGLSAP